MVEELSSYTPQDLADLNALMHELSATSFCNEELLHKALNDANVHVYVIRYEGRIVATGTLFLMKNSLIKRQNWYKKFCFGERKVG